MSRHPATRSLHSPQAFKQAYGTGGCRALNLTDSTDHTSVKSQLLALSEEGGDTLELLGQEGKGLAHSHLPWLVLIPRTWPRFYSTDEEILP